MFKRVTLSTPDPEAAARFLCEALGHTRQEEEGVAVVSRGGAEVALLKGPASTPPIVLTVMADAYDKTSQAIKEAGGDQIKELSGKRRCRFFKAPGGLVIEVVHRRKGR